MFKKKKIKIISSTRGNIIKFFNFKQKFLKKYGEIYFSEIKKINLKVGNIITREIK